MSKQLLMLASGLAAAASMDMLPDYVPRTTKGRNHSGWNRPRSQATAKRRAANKAAKISRRKNRE